MEIKMIRNYMQESKLLDVLKKLKTPETNEEELYNVFTSNLNVMFLKNEETLFKIDDVGDKFFIILKGKVEVSKPIRKKKLMNQLEFMDYLIDLRSKDDKYLILYTIRSNYEHMCFHSYEDFLIFENVYLKMNLLEHINLNTYAFNQFKNIRKSKAIANEKNKDANEINLDSILEIFRKAKKVPSDYCLEIKYMKSLTNIELRHYIKENIKISNYEEDIYEKYKFVFIMDKELKMFIIYEYVILSTLSEGQLFGDFALDSVKKKRTATVKGVENCALGWISNEVYEKYIFQETQKIRVKDLQFLNTNVIFNPIKPYQFEKLYFCEFVPKTYLRGETLIKQGSESNKIILIKEGKVEVYFHASLLEIQDFLKEIIQKGKDFKLYSEEDHDLLLNEVINDKLLQIKSQEFVKSINKTKTFLIVTLTENDMVGLEPIFFSMNNFYSVVAKTDKIQAFEIEKEKLDIIFNHHDEVRTEFKNIVGKKLNAFIKRFLTVKSSLEDLFTSKNEYHCKLEKIVINNMQKKKLLSKQKIPININFQNTAYPLVPTLQKNKFPRDDGKCIKNKKISQTLSDENLRNNSSDENVFSGTESNLVNFNKTNYKYEQQSENYSNYNFSNNYRAKDNLELEERAKNLNISKIKNLFNTDKTTHDKNKDTSNEHNFPPLIKSKKKIVIVENLNKTKSSRHEDTSCIDSENLSDYNKKDYSFKDITNSSLFSKSKEKFNFTYKKIECPPLKAEGTQNAIEKVNDPNPKSEKEDELKIKFEKNEDNPSKLFKEKKKRKKLNDEIFLSQFQSNVIMRSLPKIKLKKGMLSSNLKVNILPKLFKMENNNYNINQNTQPSETFKYFIANKSSNLRKNSIALSEKWKNSLQAIPLKNNNVNKSKDESNIREEIVQQTNNMNNSNRKLKNFILTDKKKKFESSDSLYRIDNIKSSEHKNLSTILITNSQRLNSNKKKIPYTIYDCKLGDFSKTHLNTIDNIENTNILTKTSCDFNRISTDIFDKIFNNNRTNLKRGSEDLNKEQKKVLFDKIFGNRNSKEDFNKSINSNFNTINIFTNTSLYNTNNTFKNKNNFLDNQYEATESYFFPNINSNKLKAKSFHLKTNVLNTSSSNYNYRNFTERNISTFISPKGNTKVSFENKSSNENNIMHKITGNNKLNHLFYGEISSIKTDAGINFSVTDSKKFPKHLKKFQNQTKPGDLLQYYISYLNRDLKRNLFQNTIKNKSPAHKKAKIKVDLKSIKIEHLSKDKSFENNKSKSKEKTFTDIKKKKNAQTTKKSLHYLKKL